MNNKIIHKKGDAIEFVQSFYETNIFPIHKVYMKFIDIDYEYHNNTCYYNAKILNDHSCEIMEILYLDYIRERNDKSCLVVKF